MLKKIFGGLLLLGLFHIQLANSLECYSCNSTQSCKSPELIICNSTYSNQTNAHLKQHFINYINETSSDFNCLSQNYKFGEFNTVYKGCVYDSVQTCVLVPKPSKVAVIQRLQTCKQCRADLCNSARTLSSSMLSVFVSFTTLSVYIVLTIYNL